MRCGRLPPQRCVEPVLAFGGARPKRPIRSRSAPAWRSPAAARRPARCCWPRSNIWRDDVNAKGGLLGRPVEFIYYDDQSTPSNVPGIYTKLITVDKVDLLLGPYATNFVAPAMPTIIQHNKMTISLTAIGINRHFNYPKYFSMVPVGPDGVNAFSKGFFEIAAQQKPKPQTVAILAADAEFARSASDGAREELKKHGFRLDLRPELSAAHHRLHADGARDPGGQPRHRLCRGLSAGQRRHHPRRQRGRPDAEDVRRRDDRHADHADPVQLGPVANGLVISETFLPSPKLQFAGLDDLMKRYQAKAPELKTDPIGYAFVPIGYAAGQILAKAVTETKSLDHDKLADYMRKNSFDTVVGADRVRQGRRMDEARQFTTQFQNVAAEQSRPVPRRLEDAGPVAARIQERRHHLSLRRREEEAVG